MDFSAVETQFKELKRQFEAGMLTEEDLKAQLEALMIQGEKGKWWMIGFESGQWHYHDGEKWVQSEPPPVTKRRREQAEALCQEGAESLSDGKWGTAVQKYKAALTLEPEHAEARAGLAEAEARLEEASKPAVQEKSRVPPTAPKKKWAPWVVVAIIGVILVVVLIRLINPPRAEAPLERAVEVHFWADHEVIARGDCTFVSWETAGLEAVHISGPGFDADQALAPGGKRKICPEATSGFELLHPDIGILAFLEIRVQE